MAAKPKSQFSCAGCGSVQPKWVGQCPDCKEWNTLEPITIRAEPKGNAARQGYAGSGGGRVTTLDAVPTETLTRISTGLPELDRVYGGGLVLGGSSIIGGNPGAGKSTMLLQAASAVAEGRKALYISGEESLDQIKDRGMRLRLPLDKLLALAEMDVTAIAAELERVKPALAIVDSIQTCYHPDLPGTPGSVSQVKTCAAFLNSAIKTLGIALIFVGHITKSESLAGPQALMHIVDTVLNLSSTDDARYRIMRSLKNRFGDTGEIGVFAMTGTGIRCVDNPSAVFLSRAIEQTTGSVVTPLWEGSRPMLVEMQALVNEIPGGGAMRPVCVGVDDRRVAMLMAVLQKHSGLQIGSQAVYINVAGGIDVQETSCDLPLLIAAVSSFREKVIPSSVIAFGEVGLSGEVRPVQNGQDRIREAAKLGFRRAIVPAGNFPREPTPGIDVIPVVTLSQAVDWVADLEQDQEDGRRAA